MGLYFQMALSSGLKPEPWAESGRQTISQGTKHLSELGISCKAASERSTEQEGIERRITRVESMLAVR